MSANRVGAVKGMNDLLPEQSALWQRLEAAARRIFGLYGFDEVRTPIVEQTSLFVRGVGEETDIVGKEMYSFTDQGNEALTLRPEGTASCVRAYVEHDRHTVDPVQKWFYLGPMFRRERPQKGRYRQFHQIGAELFGAPEPRADIEMIAMIHRYLVDVGVQGVVLRVNSLGDDDSRPAFREALVKYFEPHKATLGETDQRRLEKNPLRLLDSKDPATQALAKGAPSTLDHLSPASQLHFEAVVAGLKALQIPFEIDPTIVRGLDYYTRTTFEFIATTGLGAQSTVAAGGRYDGLVEQLGGPKTPGIGFALGLERLALLLEGQSASAKIGPDVFIGTQGDTTGVTAITLAEACRAAGLRVELTLRSANVGNQLKRANRLGATFALVLGDGEAMSGVVRLKRMATGVEQQVSLADVPATVAGHLGYAAPSVTGKLHT